MSQTTRICVVTTSKADYGRILPLIKEIQSRERSDNLVLQVVLGTKVYTDHLFSHLLQGDPASFFASLPWLLRARAKMMFGGSEALEQVDQLASLLKRDGVSVSARIPMHLEGNEHSSMLRTAGFALLGAAKAIKKLAPDVIMLHGDRAELLTIAAAATMLHIPLIHIEGGDVSGTVDEHIRHAISKLSHLHFPITQKSAERLVHMGEDPKRVLPSGMLALDTVASIDLAIDNSFYDRFPKGFGRIDLLQPFLMVMYHPVTTHAKEAAQEAKNILKALSEVGLPLFILAPNNDSGGQAIHEAMGRYAQTHPDSVAFYKGVPVDDFYRLMHAARVCVGNSSSFVRESAFLGTPVVLVGDRQYNRERGENVVSVACETQPIAQAIRAQLAHGSFPRDERFGTGNVAKKIVDAIVAADFSNFNFQKFFYEKE